jgi:hypothetical protein
MDIWDHDGIGDSDMGRIAKRDLLLDARLDTEAEAMSIDVFCRRHGFSRAMLYMLWDEGRGPKCFRIGARRMISAEAAREWRQRMESETAVDAARGAS